MQSTGYFSIPYPTRMDSIGAATFSDMANKIDNSLSRVAGTGQVVQMQQSAGSYLLQTSNHFVNDYDAGATLRVSAGGSGSDLLTPFTDSGLLTVPDGWCVLVSAYMTFFGAPLNGTVAVGIGAAPNSTATVPTVDLGGALLPTATNFTATVPPIAYRNTTGRTMYVGLYSRCALTPPCTTYGITMTVLSRATMN